MHIVVSGRHAGAYIYEHHAQKVNSICTCGNISLAVRGHLSIIPRPEEEKGPGFRCPCMCVFITDLAHIHQWEVLMPSKSHG